MGLKNFINHKKAEYLADPAEFINKRLDKVGNVAQAVLNAQLDAMNARDEEIREIQRVKEEEPQLHIGRVELASSLLSEARDNQYVHDFAMACVRRQREYDW